MSRNMVKRQHEVLVGMEIKECRVKSKMKKKKVLHSRYGYWMQKEMETKWTKVYDTQSIDGDSSGLPSE